MTSDEPILLPVSGTQSRPSFLPGPFVLGRNNLNPKLLVDAGGVLIKVVFETRLAWGQIKSVDVMTGFTSKYAVFNTDGWDYNAHFTDEAALRTLLQRLKAHGVALSERATQLL